MAMGRWKRESQAEFWIPADRVPEAPAHPFYGRLNRILAEAGFDAFCEGRCEKFYARRMGRTSIPPGVYFRMLMIGYFEKLDSERQIAWRCDDSRALRAFLGYAADEETPDHSSLTRVRERIDVETHQAIFDWALARLAEKGLLKGKTVGVDASTMEADAAMRSIVRKGTGETYREFLEGLAQASGSRTAAGSPGRRRTPRIRPGAGKSSRRCIGIGRRLRGDRSKRLHRKRGELAERSFEHVLDDGGMRRTWLKGRDKVQKRYLIHVSAFNLGLILRTLTGYGTPKGLADGLRDAARCLCALARDVWSWFWTMPAPRMISLAWRSSTWGDFEKAIAA